jgi:tRNA nucleotidyltransferase (CCA-adding enzyme)
MQVFLVGGAVRDELLGLTVKDRDWVVVGSTPQELIALGYTPVGKDFPVFLHPQTHEEYALARTERKNAPGYHGFSFHASPEVTLEEDLARRDLTINAMAKNVKGELIDPYGGERDLRAKVFKHVSPAFKEDPVRVLRLARFAARFPDFTLADETLHLAQSMAQSGEIKALVPERVWAEIGKALMHEKPSRLFQVLMDCQAFKILFAPISSLEDEPVARHRFFQSLDEAARKSSSLEVRFALCFYPFAFPLEPPSASMCLSKTDVQSMCDALKVSTGCKDMAILMLQLCQTELSVHTLNAAQTLELIESLDGLRRPDRLKGALEAALIASKFADHLQHQKALEMLTKALTFTLSVEIKPVTAAAVQNGIAGAQIGELIHQARLQALLNLLGS